MRLVGRGTGVVYELTADTEISSMGDVFQHAVAAETVAKFVDSALIIAVVVTFWFVKHKCHEI